MSNTEYTIGGMYRATVTRDFDDDLEAGWSCYVKCVGKGDAGYDFVYNCEDGRNQPVHESELADITLVPRAPWF